MTRLLRPLLLFAALLFSQHAALLHGLAHAEHELALASNEQEEGAPALDHGAEVCAAFGALAHALDNATQPLPCAAAPVAAHLASFSPAAETTRIHFDSRAPPYSA